MRISGARHGSLALLLAAAVSTAHVSALGSAGHRSSIERTYELTKYLEHQLRDIKHTYLSYLGPPFSDPDFAPPRPNSSALALPSAATRFELWKGLENRARLLQNHRAYSLLLGAVRELAQSTVCPYLQRSLLHFCTGLDGLLGSISGLLTALGYPLPPTEPPAPGAPDPEGGDSEEGAGPLAWGGRRERGLSTDRMWGAPLYQTPQNVSGAPALLGELGEGEGWWPRRRPLGLAAEPQGSARSRRPPAQRPERSEVKRELAPGGQGEGVLAQQEEGDLRQGRAQTAPLSDGRRRPRSLPPSPPDPYAPTLHPPLSPLPLYYGFGVRGGHTVLSGLERLDPGGPLSLRAGPPLSSPLASPPLGLNDFSRKVESFWVLRELQSWLWRSAKDFNRLKKRLRA
ncbi:uncharacterized protein clcf1 isoform X2 [Lepisosteus oculatus]